MLVSEMVMLVPEMIFWWLNLVPDNHRRLKVRQLAVVIDISKNALHRLLMYNLIIRKQFAM